METVGTFLAQPLKSSLGPEEWLRFFTVTSSIFALHESTTPVRGTPTGRDELKAILSPMMDVLKVDMTLTGFSEALKMVESEERLANAKYYLLELQITEANASR